MFEPKSPQDRIIEELWLSQASWIIYKAGGYISVNELSDMSLRRFAMICGRNGLTLHGIHKPIMPPEFMRELVKYGLEGGPKGEKE